MASNGAGLAAGTDVVARWNVPMINKIYKIEFSHGTTTGKRIICVNGKEIMRRDWMFKLVGRECFELAGVRCVIAIEAIGIFAYEYSLKVGGKSFEKFREQQERSLLVWHVRLGPNSAPTAAAGDAGDLRICLEKNTMDVWVNGSRANTTGEFMESGGTRTHFEAYPAGDGIAESSEGSAAGGNGSGVEVGPRRFVACYIETESSGRRSVGILHKLYVDGVYVPPANALNES